MEFVAERTYANKLKLLPAPIDDTVTTITELTSTVALRPYWVRGRPKLLDKSQRLWYYACPSCYKYIRARPTWEINCTSCHQSIRVIPRCRLTVQLSDISGNITLDLNGEDAEQLLPFTVAEIQRQESEVKT